MTTKLAVYNEALRLMGEGRLASITEARAARYHLDDAYATGVTYCLEQGFWNFAMRAVQIDHSVVITPRFGFAYAFERPTDWVRTWIASPTEQLDLWPGRFNDEATIWYADVDPLYAKYVSSDVGYGLNLAAWPETFAHFVACRLARMTCGVISSTSADKLDELKKDEKKAKLDARSKDAMAEPPTRMPQGSWVNSRSNGLLRRPRSTSGGMIF